MCASAESYWLSFFIHLGFLELRPFVLRVDSTFSRTILVHARMAEFVIWSAAVFFLNYKSSTLHFASE